MKSKSVTIPLGLLSILIEFDSVCGKTTERDCRKYCCRSCFEFETVDFFPCHNAQQRACDCELKELLTVPRNSALFWVSIVLIVILNILIGVGLVFCAYKIHKYRKLKDLEKVEPHPLSTGHPASIPPHQPPLPPHFQPQHPHLQPQYPHPQPQPLSGHRQTLYSLPPHDPKGHHDPNHPGLQHDPSLTSLFTPTSYSAQTTPSAQTTSTQSSQSTFGQHPPQQHPQHPPQQHPQHPPQQHPQHPPQQHPQHPPQQHPPPQHEHPEQQHLPQQQRGTLRPKPY